MGERTEAQQALAAAAHDARACTACPLHEHATQTVFGAGAADARLVLIGEQPGDREDVAGEPFVGPAGRVLWECVQDAGIDRGSIYVTNAVKHFKFEQRGKRRIHQKPNVGEINACRPWLELEVAAMRADAVLVLLGATAVRAAFGRDVPIARGRGQVHDVVLHGQSRRAVITYHPSAVLRADERAGEIRAALIEDLHAAQSLT